jgi:hypothetical protein
MHAWGSAANEAADSIGISCVQNLPATYLSLTLSVPGRIRTKKVFIFNGEKLLVKIFEST